MMQNEASQSRKSKCSFPQPAGAIGQSQLLHGSITQRYHTLNKLWQIERYIFVDQKAARKKKKKSMPLWKDLLALAHA